MSTWALPATVDLAVAPALLSELQNQVAAAGAGELKIDCSATRAFDSSLIALLLEARRRVQRAGGTLVVSGASPKLVELAQLYGVNELVLG
jgi:phospholipid transport system transporter-binding protein